MIKYFNWFVGPKKILIEVSLKKEFIMSGIGNFIWRISVALYLLATGVLGTFYRDGHLKEIFGEIFKGNTNVIVVIAGIIAFLAGLFLLLELFGLKIAIIDILVLVLAIIWVVFIVFGVISWIGGNENFWFMLQRIGVNVMVCASLFIASRKFGG